MNLATYIDRLESPNLHVRVGVGTVLRSIPPHPFPNRLRMIVEASAVEKKVALITLTPGGLAGTLVSPPRTVHNIHNLSSVELRSLVTKPSHHEIVPRALVTKMLAQLTKSPEPFINKTFLDALYFHPTDNLPRVDQLRVCPKCGAVLHGGFVLRHVPHKNHKEVGHKCWSDCPNGEHMHVRCTKCWAWIVARPVT